LCHCIVLLLLGGDKESLLLQDLFNSSGFFFFFSLIFLLVRGVDGVATLSLDVGEGLLVEFRLLNIFDESGSSVLSFVRLLNLFLLDCDNIVVRNLCVWGFNLLNFNFLNLDYRCGNSGLDNIILA
jgi:hypothetical protein